MKLRQSILLATLAAFAGTLTGCGGGGSSTPPPATVTVSLSGQPQSLSPSATASITATVSNSAGVTWTVTCATSPCGSFSSTSTASGAPTTYTAPSAPTSVTVTATTASGATASATITIAAPPITVAFNPAAPPTLSISTTANLTAVVTNDSQNKGVTWSCAPASSCGTFNPTSTASGTATVYTAPSAVPTSGSVTVTATSVTDTTKTAVATINITPPALTVTFNPAPPTSLIVGTTSSITAIVSNDSQNKGVTWTVTCGSSACGSFSSASTASGTATVYTVPTTIPSPNTVKITATSVTDTTKSATATITITPVLADGTYVYHFSGWDNTGPAFFTGAFTVSGGVITGGEQDFSDVSIGYPDVSLVAANCSLSAAGNNIQVVLGIPSSVALGVNGLETLRGTMVSGSRILINEFDSFATATGSIDLQTTPVAAPSGGYAFLISGWDIDTGTSPATLTQLAIGGILNFTGTTLSIGNSVFDYNVGGTVGQNQLFSSGSINGPDSFGRVSISLTPTNVPSFILTGYIVSTGQIQLVESQQDTLSDDLGGVALGQGSNTGTFSLSSLAGTTYVFASSGQDENTSATFGGLATFGGSLSFNSGGGLSGILAINDGQNALTTSITSGSYIVDPTGRATLSSILTSAFPAANDAFTFQLYLDGNGNALHLGADLIEYTSGPAYRQTATASDFEGPYALSGSGIINATNIPAWGAVGPVTVSGDNLTGAADYNAQGLTPISATPVTATENSTSGTPGTISGTLSVTGLDASSFTSSRLYSYFPIDNKRVLAIETDGAQLGILALESTSH
jgi:hypothetical protein